MGTVSLSAIQAGFENKAGIIVKGLFDFIVALIGGFLILPVLLVIALMVKRDTPGPAFYWSPRTGKNGKQFRMLKFRTMFEQLASYQGPRVTGKDDSRITPLGRWLRDTKLNELPQIWNVIKGEMSLVGPRPEDPEISQQWPGEAKQEILSVKPGITSPASIYYRDEENMLSSSNLMRDYYLKILPDKLRLDRLYVRNRTFWGDLDILFWTAAILVPRLVTTEISPGLIFAGPIYCLVKRYISWFLVDLVTTFGAVCFVGFGWRLQKPLNWGVLPLALFALFLALLFSGANWFGGLNRIHWSRATIEDAFMLILISSVVTGVLLVVNLFGFPLKLSGFPALPAIMLVNIGFLSQIGFLTTRFRWRIITAAANRWLSLRQRKSAQCERVLILGSNEQNIELAIWLLNHFGFQYGFSIMGIVENDILTRKGMVINGCQVLGELRDLPKLVQELKIDMIVNTAVGITSHLTQILQQCDDRSLPRVVDLNQLSDALQRQFNQEPIAAMRDTVIKNPFVVRIGDDDFLQKNQRDSQNLKDGSNIATLRIVVAEPETEYGVNPRMTESTANEIYHRIRGCIRDSDQVTRMGTNNFVVRLNHVNSKDEVTAVTKRISASVRSLICDDGIQVTMKPQKDLTLEREFQEYNLTDEQIR